jgi:4-hydroxy-tetrahydrodipicolinate synthase
MQLRGCGTALVTPFQQDGSIDERALRSLVEWQIESGIDFLVPCGTTGETPTLSHDEWLRVIDITVEVGRGRVPIVGGATSNSTREAVQNAKEIAPRVDFILTANPYYNKPTQEGQYQHFKAIAEAVGDLPIILYNVPGRTVADMQHETVLRLAQVPGIVGIKEATANIERAQWLIRDVPKGFSVYSGDDPTAVALMLCGGQGNVSVTANIAPRLMHQLCMAAVKGDAAGAMAIQRKLMPVHKQLFIEANPIPLKWAMARMGLCGPTLRLPMTPLAEAHQGVVEAALRASGLVA